MASCKDCVHFDVCGKVMKLKWCVREEEQIPLATCKSFKSKSLFVELPCKVGDIIHTARYGESHPFRITRLVIDSDYEKYGFHLKCFGTEFLETEIGDTVFFTTEEAKQKLKELKNERINN